MKQRRYFTQPEMEEIWDRWENVVSAEVLEISVSKADSRLEFLINS